MVIFLLVWALAAVAIFWRGTYDLVKIVGSIRWLKRGVEHFVQSDSENPLIIVLLPVLREQRLIIDTLQHFANLRYPQERLRIFIITTEKEVVERQTAKEKLILLARDIASKRYSVSLLKEKYLGLFSEDVLTRTLLLAQDKKSEQEVLQFLLEVFQAYPTTITLVKENIDRINLQIGVPIFTHLHYPGTNGNMNQQLDYALKHLSSYLNPQEFEKIPPYLVVYNADSRPHVDTLGLMMRICNNYYHEHDSYPKVLQQPAIYLENISHLGLGSRLAGLLLQATALLQSRWVLSHEIPRLQRQSRSALLFDAGKLNLFHKLTGADSALCVGHGLFLRYDVARDLELFSLQNIADSTIADDLLWSFLLCINHIPMLPIPLLESAESPTTVKSLILQKGGWFLGYTQYFRCRMAALESNKFNRTDVELVTLHGLFRAITWLLLSPAIFLAFTLPVLAHSGTMFLITSAVYAIYGFLTYWKIVKEFETLKGRSGGEWNPLALSTSRKIALVIFSLPAFLIESIGLWLCLYQRMKWAITHKQPYRLKTER
jgi:hypothetical protein